MSDSKTAVSSPVRPADTRGTAPGPKASCCAPAEKASCCTPGEKDDCCGDGGGKCGCR